MDKAVLIISTEVDIATDEVEQELKKRNVPVVRFNSEQFPFEASLSFSVDNGSHAQLTLNGYRNFRSIWYRRIRPPSCPAQMDKGHFAFSEKESRFALLGGILALSSEIPILNNPSAVWAAEHKLYQLAVAKQLGLRIPESITGNVPSEAMSFFEKHKPNVIAKPVRTGYLEDANGPKAIYTSRVENSHMSQINRLAVSPVTFQNLINKQSDIRVTIIGQKVYCAEILSQTDQDASIDWRRTSNPELPHKHHKLPEALQQQLLQFMQRLNLEYGAIDLVLDDAGTYYFLEVNPGGQWLWLDRILDLGITQCIADWLSNGGNI